MQLLCGDCLKLMADIPDQSVDAVIADLPYGITQAKWDCEIDLEALWKEYKRIAKPSAPFVLFGSQPFTTKLIASNIGEFKYCWYWKKEKGNGFLNANKQPLRAVEEICVFYHKQCTFNRQGCKLESPRTEYLATKPSETLGRVGSFDATPSTKVYTEACPTNVLEFKRDKKNRIHSTQKPLALLEYLVLTYTNKGETVLDNCMGSGTAGVACCKLERDFIGIELDKGIFDKAVERIKEATDQLTPCDT